ncbi:hypothetical protein UFOVP1146_92 [uncultured Caudovirales phage]|uniref:Uncharacterized protein n=1 Tax=uncultured Caudovirales phage TaxID=2100421 RepID=A0A6J5P2L5_9CAUD|nr:hypothetical protein UFOVP812_5 [uncultured Caudovirales phage]CAB4165603.1 hypothetical protein UFOVP818_139 [uncultured Caudovirales phage]CAB4186746.1 hypothetical protein UFOVP1146_92 [uncultured Caudovirales phage]CAB4220744.1 hypothetical protein UFOVP1638_52 [uncultured Caudovirales phage]
MKLTELAAPNLTKQLTQVFESYFGKRVPFATVTSTQARSMLQRVRGLLREHRAQPAFHISERNPAYLKLIMLEQGLTSKLREEISPIAPTAPTTPAKPIDPKLLAAQKKLTAKQPLTPEEQLIINASVIANESRRRTLYNILRESEIQQAQVVLASQDMVDRVQKMLEDVSSMQFKDLPALVDQIKNEVGVDQSAQFNNDATAALSGLVQNLQGSKQQLEAALGVVTGQASTMPGAPDQMGADAGMMPPDDTMAMPDDTLAPPDETDMMPDEVAPPAALGRARR